MIKGNAFIKRRLLVLVSSNFEESLYGDTADEFS